MQRRKALQELTLHKTHMGPHFSPAEGCSRDPPRREQKEEGSQLRANVGPGAIRTPGFSSLHLALTTT